MEILQSLPLVKIDDRHYLHEAIVSDFLKLRQAANNAGVNLDIASSYRPVERQLLIWNEKWSGKRPLLNRVGTPCDASALTDKEKLDTILIWSALPGTSRHHWGTDIDVYDAPRIAESGKTLQLVPDEYLPGGPCGQLKRWMNDNLEAMGFYCPYATDNGGVAYEPWHISHLAQSAKFERLLTPEALATTISQLDILGKSTILENLEVIHRQFIK
ncbi:M15 family metallopeptidase [Planctobacterium marinum]|uniref:M15 family metallopeptidase n=1 Tax=Planctobacterium marinum TaxID=1631968 RepID=UPI001E573BF3|nr:M15 family metallopeptidase [Planctobacterium marinum]MCC2604445.1 M15 family metallopeptidase [Planctobacterium marinum]